MVQKSLHPIRKLTLLDIKEQIAPDITIEVNFNTLLLLEDYLYKKLMNKHQG